MIDHLDEHPGLDILPTRDHGHERVGRGAFPIVRDLDGVIQMDEQAQVLDAPVMKDVVIHLLRRRTDHADVRITMASMSPVRLRMIRLMAVPASSAPGQGVSQMPNQPSAGWPSNRILHKSGLVWSAPSNWIVGPPLCSTRATAPGHERANGSVPSASLTFGLKISRGNRLRAGSNL